MIAPRVYTLGDRRVYVGPEHRLADRRGWVSLVRLARADAPPEAPLWSVRCYPHDKGYTHILVGERHPYANKGGKVLLHRLVFMTHLGRRLGWYEHVHHVNEIKGDLRVGNLELLEEAEHGRYHYGRRVGCGAHVCPECGGSGCTHCRQGLVAGLSRGSL